MHPSTSRMILVLLGLLVGYTATVVADGGTPAPNAAKIAVVDIGLLFTKYARKDELEQHINKVREGMKKQLEDDEKRLLAKRKALEELYKPGTEAYEQEMEKIALESKGLEMKEQRLQRQLKKQVEEMTLQVLDELNDTIGVFGKKYGYTAVLKVDRTGKDENASAGELTMAVQERLFRAQFSDVLYFDPSVDATPGVLSLLNSPENKTRLEQRAKGGAQTPKPPASQAQNGG